MKASRISAPEDCAPSLRLESSISLNRRLSSFSSKSYQYLPRTKTPVSPYLSSRSWMPLKIFEKVSPFLKFSRPSSLVCDRRSEERRVGRECRGRGRQRE